jgi:hypothetical protein
MFLLGPGGLPAGLAGGLDSLGQKRDTFALAPSDGPRLLAGAALIEVEFMPANSACHVTSARVERQRGPRGHGQGGIGMRRL